MIDNERYKRQLMVTEIGEEGQIKLYQASVSIIGCGALGCIVASYLCGAGVGEITIIDFDKIDISNLHRQVIYTANDIGKPKADILARHLAALNSECRLDVINDKLTAQNCHELISGNDLVIDATDNPNVKHLIANYCQDCNQPFITAGIDGWHGQVMLWQPGCIPFNDIFGDIRNTFYEAPGVVGSTPALAAALQASEAIKFITCPHYIGSLICFNTLTSQFSTFPIKQL